jgi:hypothetical protein
VALAVPAEEEEARIIVGRDSDEDALDGLVLPAGSQPGGL